MEELYSLDPETLAARLLALVGEGTWPPVHEAIEMARTRHAGQLRKEGAPFLAHPLRVALLLAEVGGIHDAAMLCAALLHDILEDTDTTADEIHARFGSKVADLVRSMTLPPLREGQSKGERDRAHFEGLAWEGRDPQILRSADRLDNIRSLGKTMPPERKEEYLRDTRNGLLPLTLATNTALYHALAEALERAGG